MLLNKNKIIFHPIQYNKIHPRLIGSSLIDEEFGLRHYK